MTDQKNTPDTDEKKNAPDTDKKPNPYFGRKCFGH